MLLRVRSKDGQARIECQETDSTSTLLHKIASELNVPAEEQKLSKDPAGNETISISKVKTVQSMGLKHGDLIYTHYNRELETEAPKEPPKKYNPTEPLREKKMKWTMQEYLEYREKVEIRIKAQDEAHASAVDFDSTSAMHFQSYMQQIAFQNQRVGYLYGKFNEDGSVEVDSVYEPPQDAKFDSCQVKERDSEVERADNLAKLLGLSRVGWILATYPREYILSSREIVRAAELQNQFGDKFVTVVVSLTEDGQSSFEAFQVSDQCMELQREGIFDDWSNPELLKTNEIVYIDQKGKGRQETKEIDPTFFLVTVAIRQRQGPYSISFPIENRGRSQELTDLKKCLTEGKKTFLQRMTDFHALLFISRYLDMKADMPHFCQAILSQDTDHLAGFEYLVKQYAGIDM